jgi:hypothetical protein
MIAPRAFLLWMETESMDIDVEEIDGGVTNVVLRGRLDTVLSPDKNVRTALEMAGIEQFMPIVFDRGAAIASVQR